MPKERLAKVLVEALVLDGGLTPWLSHAAEAIASALPDAQRRTLSSQPHNVEATAIAPVLAEFFVA